MEKLRLESVIDAYQTENLRLESPIVELQRQFKDSCSRFAQANDQTLQMSRQLHDKSANLAEHARTSVD
jgi:hypothetical protein